MFYFLVVTEQTGLRYMNSLGKRCSMERALRTCEQARNAGALAAIVFLPNGDFMVGVTPWAEEGFTDRDFVAESSAFRNLTDSRGFQC